MIHNQSEYIQHLEAEVKFCKVRAQMYACVYICCPFCCCADLGTFLFISLCACLQEELQGMKQRIRVVVVENEKLHLDLKSKAVDESLKDYTIRNSSVMCVCVCESHVYDFCHRMPNKK